MVVVTETPFDNDEFTVDPCVVAAATPGGAEPASFQLCNNVQAVNSSLDTLCLSGLFAHCVNHTTPPVSVQSKFPDIRSVTIALYLLTFVFGVTGNTLVIYVIGKYEKIRKRSVSNYYIWNLAFADVLFVVTLPFFCFPTYANNWPFGMFMCKLLTVFRECNKYASVLTLVALSIDRFLATFHQFGRFRQIKCGVIACIIIWFICLVMSTPYWLYADVVTTKVNRYSCLILWPNLANFHQSDFRRLWAYFQLIFGLLVPFAVIATFSILLLKRMRHHSDKAAAAASRHRMRPSSDAGQQTSRLESENNQVTSRLLRRNQANSSMTRVVLAIVVTFGVCHLPYHVNEVIAEWIVRRQQHNMQVISVLIYINVIVQILVFIASCSNPIIYGVLNKNYRELCDF